MVLPLSAFRRLDLNAVEAGVSLHQLMAQAGKALAEAARGHDRVVLLCGKGNNGGDGFAAAGLLLRWGADVQVVLVAPRHSVQGAAAHYLELIPKDRVHAWGPDRRRWKNADVVIDCMLGSGIRGAPRKPFDQAIRWFNKHAGHKIVCDLPSGLGTTLQTCPDVSVTFHDEKEGMAGRSGEIRVVDIGIPKAAHDIGIGDLDAGFPRQRSAGHKGDHGRVLIVGGGPFDGAPHYAGMGAVRAGVDLVHVLAPEPSATALRHWGPDLLIHAAGDGHLRPTALPEIAFDALVIGPGLGTHPETVQAIRDILDATDVPGVVDADALRALDDDVLRRHGSRLVLTPHGQEFKRLTGKAANAKNVQNLAIRYDLIVLAKAATDLVANPTEVRHCRRGHPAMTVGGTGDVLAGVVAALLARGASRFEAACAAAYLVGRAGEMAASMRGAGMTATDLHEAIPAILAPL